MYNHVSFRLEITYFTYYQVSTSENCHETLGGKAASLIYLQRKCWAAANPTVSEFDLD